MKQFTYIQVSNPKDAVNAASKETNAQFIAGGTNLIDLMKRGVAAPDTLIDINNLTSKSIEHKNGVTLIGALALNTDVAENKHIRENHPLLSKALEAGASAQIRNMATVGGNMLQRTRCTYFYDTALPCNKREPGSGCGALTGYNRMHAIFGASESCIAVHPSDMCVALSALDATVIVTGKKGGRRILFTDFHRLAGDHPEKDTVLEKGDLITAIEIPDNNLNKNFYYLKIRDRASYAFALVSVAAALEISGGSIITARLAMGGVAHKPWRLTEAEKMLAGKPVSEEAFKGAAQIAVKDAKAYQHNSYKLKLAPNAVLEALKKAAEMA